MKIAQNFYLKLISLLLGITLWFYVQGKESVETSLKITLFFSNVSEEFYLDDVSTSDITVWIKGPRPIVSNFIRNDNKLDISLKGYKSGKYSLPITTSMLDFPRNIEVIRIQPDKISFKIKPFVEKRVRVIADYKGSISYRITPQFVVVKGEAKSLENIEYLYTEQIDEVKGAKEIVVKLVTPAGNVKVIPDKVKISFK